MSKKKPADPRIIALLTDYGWHNWYMGVMKGVILGINPDVRIVDLCHDVSSRDVREGSYILGNTFNYFPHGTIFLCVVDPGVGGKRKNLIIQTEDYYFVSPDNGILSSIFEKGMIRKVFNVRPGKYTLSLKGSTFHGRDIFGPIAAHLSLGVSPEAMGEELESVLTVPALTPFINDQGYISGRAVFVDTFGNILTNIDEDYLESVFPNGVPWDNCRVRLSGKSIKGVKRYYAQGERGKLMALINSWGYLEIAVNGGSAFKHLELKE
ncbi:MAG: SAM-dependent chlorinase/fluorinase, partial [Candidatus Krumholzibacteria bacterium]|nr:SAM-dependent chlorinase/fluorinase [Candidatus Krumholzibacteria bacterium]